MTGRRAARVILTGVDESTPDGRRQLANFQDWLRTASYEDMERRFGPPNTETEGGPAWRVRLTPNSVTTPGDDDLVDHYLTDDEKAAVKKARLMREALDDARKEGTTTLAIALRLLAAYAGKAK